MPLKLVPPDPKRSPFYRVRGTYLGTYIDRSTQTGDRTLAQRRLTLWREEIERGCYARPDAPTFASAAIAYMSMGGEKRFLPPLLKHFGERPLATIDQRAIDEAAVALYPAASNATRNRQVYSPVSAILKAGGVDLKLSRPKGARGRRRIHWLWPEQALPLVDAAIEQRERFGVYLMFLLFTGCRMQEPLNLKPDDLRLAEGFAYIEDTKTGEPRGVHLPPVLVAALANLDTSQRVFGWRKCGRLYTWIKEAEEASGVTIPDGVAFHIFRHTYATWMRRYGGADTTALVNAGAWKDRKQASQYEHVDVSEDARRADMFPTSAKSVRLKG
jgi:integrase